MGLLNRPSDGLPSVGIAVAKFLAKEGPHPLERIRLLCDPVGLNDNQASQVQQTVNRWVQLGVFVQEDDNVRLSAEDQGRHFFSNGDPLLEALRWFVLQRVTRSASSPIDDCPAGDFLIAAWCLLQLDPAQTWLDSDKTAIKAAAERFPERTVIQNDTRWQGLLDWIQFLGLGTVLDGGLTPNPTSAVRWALREPAFEVGRPVPSVDFMRNLIDELPLFGDGTAARAAASYLDDADSLQTPGRRVSRALSLALLSLESQGALSLEGRQDSTSIILLQRLDGTERRVETVTVQQG